MATKQILRPTSVKVGHMDFSIAWIDEKEWLQKDDNDKAGSSWYSNGAIRVRMQNTGVDVHEDGSPRVPSPRNPSLLLADLEHGPLSERGERRNRRVVRRLDNLPSSGSTWRTSPSGA
jgi:hypothetical protein